MKTEDGDIIYKCLNGDSTAFGLLVDKYKESIYALAYSRLQNFHDAEDVTQEVFINAYQKLKTLRRWDSFLGWIYSITSNLCKMHIRKQSQKPETEPIEDQELYDKDWGVRYREESLDDSLHEALNSLPETYKQVLTLYYLGGMSIAEISRFLGVSINAIKERLSRARAQMREEMLEMMSRTFAQQKLRAGFTFRIVEMVKNIRIHPVSPRILPWGLSLATGIMIAVFGIGTNLIQPNFTDTMKGFPLPGESKVLNVGEFSVDIIKISDTSSISNGHLNGNGSSTVDPSLQNALFMAPQAEGGVWTKKADMRDKKFALSAVTIDDKIYIIGGEAQHPDFVFSTVEEYNPVNDTWESKADLPAPRSFLSSVVLNGKIYAIGGTIPANLGCAKVEEYDPIKNEWIKKKNMPTARLSLSACVVNDKIYAIGGSTGVFNGPFLRAVEEYDLINDTWVSKADMITNRGGLSTSVVNGKIYAIGGTNQRVAFNDCIGLSAVEEYDPATDKWTKKADMPTARWGLSTIVLDNKIYAISGANRWPANPIVEIYDPLTDEWTKGVKVPTARALLSASAANGKIYTFGGYIGTEISVVEEFDPNAESKNIEFKGKLLTTWGDMRIAMNR